MPELKPILLAEDSPNDAELILEALAENKLVNRITHVKDGIEAMDYLHCQGAYVDRNSGNPAVVMLDIKMPRMDGIEVLQAIRSDPGLRLIPAVILTSSMEERDTIRSYELGVNAYIVKPVIFSDFITAVRQLGTFWALLNEIPSG